MVSVGLPNTGKYGKVGRTVGDSAIRRPAKSRSSHATQSVNPVMEILITEVPFPRHRPHPWRHHVREANWQDQVESSRAPNHAAILLREPPSDRHNTSLNHSAHRHTVRFRRNSPRSIGYNVDLKSLSLSLDRQHCKTHLRPQPGEDQLLALRGLDCGHDPLVLPCIDECSTLSIRFLPWAS